MFEDLFGSARGVPPAEGKSQRTLMQKWRRWTSGASVPARSEVCRILGIAESLGWLRSTVFELELIGLRTATLDTPSSSADTRTSRKRRRHRKTWVAELCRWQRAKEEASWRWRLRFVEPCVYDLMEEIDERLVVAGNTAPRQASLAEPLAVSEALAMFRATMVEVGCQMIEAMDCCPLVGGEDEDDNLLLEGSDLWPELLSRLGDDLFLLFRDASNEIRTEKKTQRATKSARARMCALP